MKSKDFDVIIVGGGISALSIASNLKDKDILLLEKNKDVGLEEKSPGTFRKVIKENKLENAINKRYQRHVFHSPGFTHEREFDEWFFASLDYHKICKILLKRAKKNNTVKTLFNTTAKNFDSSQTKLLSDKGDFSANILVNASGFSSEFSHRLRDYPKENYYDVLYFCKAEGLDVDQNTMYFLGAEKFGNHAGWIYPLTENESEFGLAHFVNHLEKISEGREHLEELKNNLFRDEDFKKRFGELRIQEERFDFVVNYKKVSAYSDNLILAGDAAQYILPHFGGGIENYLELGKIAAEVIEEAFQKNNFSEKFLQRYEKGCNDWLKHRYFFSALYLDLWINWDDEDWERSTKFMDTLSNEELIDLYRGKPPLWKMIKSYKLKFLEYLPGVIKHREHLF